MANQKVLWTSPGGQQFAFEVLSMSGTWSDISGLYMFCSREADTWVPQYIGQCANFRDRMTNHERWAEALGRGATSVLAMHVATQSERDRLEEILIRELSPRLNTQLQDRGRSGRASL